MDIWKEEFGVIVDFGEGTIAISDLGIMFSSFFRE